jgi:hypothetical protein
MSARDEEHIADLLASLPPAPEPWRAAAHEIPRTHRELGDVMQRIEADEEFRRAVQADIAAALERFGYAADPGAVQAVRRRLRET